MSKQETKLSLDRDLLIDSNRGSGVCRAVPCHGRSYLFGYCDGSIQKVFNSMRPWELKSGQFGGNSTNITACGISGYDKVSCTVLSTERIQPLVQDPDWLCRRANLSIFHHVAERADARVIKSTVMECLGRTVFDQTIRKLERSSFWLA